MKIALDISQAIYGTGVSNYIKNLVSSLVKLYPNDEYVLFGGSLRRKSELASLARKLKGTPKIISLSPTILDFLWNSLHVLPIESFVGDVDIVHTSDWAEPPSKLPKVTTVHDLVPFKYPQTTADNVRQAHKKRLHWVIRESRRIIAVSKSTKDDLISVLNVPEEKIVVIPEGVESRFVPQPLEIVDSIKRKYHLDHEYIFALSTLEPRKNQTGLIKAFRLVKERYPGLTLLIGGRTGWGEIPKPEPGVLMPGYIPDADLPALYSGAAAYVLPSLYEGFGLSPLQAMACGTPVVSSNISSMPEVVGNAGILVEPKDTRSITTGIIEALENRGTLIKKGLQQAEKFSWNKTARQTHQVYQEVLGEK